MSRSRPLDEAERALAQAVFLGSLDLDRVRVGLGGPLSMGAPKVLGWTVHMPFTYRGEALLAPDGQTRPERRHVLVHELVHVWQHQHGGRAYMGGSLQAQLAAVLRGEGRLGAYRFEQALGTPWASWNPEQQATAVEWWAVCSGLCPYPKPIGDPEGWVRNLQPIVDAVRAGQGAPSSSGFGAAIGALAGSSVGACAGGALGLAVGEPLLALGACVVAGAAAARAGWK